MERVERLPESFDFAEKDERVGDESLGHRQRFIGHWGKKGSEMDQVVDLIHGR